MKPRNQNSPWYTDESRRRRPTLIRLTCPLEFSNDAEMVAHARSDMAELQRPGEFLEPEDVMVSVRLRKNQMLRLLDLADIGAVEEPTERADAG